MWKEIYFHVKTMLPTEQRTKHLKQEYKTYLFTVWHAHLLEIQKLQLIVKKAGS